MNMFPVTTCMLEESFPCVSAGSGPEPLIILPHIRETVQDIMSAPWCRNWLRRLSTSGRAAHIIGRCRRSPLDSTRQAADRYAGLISRHFGPAHIMGVSFGGLVAQYLAIDHVHLVRALIAACCAHRISDDGSTVIRTWMGMAERADWHSLYFELAALSNADVRQADRQVVMSLLAPSLQHPPYSPEHFIASARAALEHDTTDMLHAIQAPSLIIAGDRDILFPVHVVRDFHARIRGARLHLISGAGHGAFDERKRDFARAVTDFIVADTGTLLK